jgi:hypothetical protein
LKKGKEPETRKIVLGKANMVVTERISGFSEGNHERWKTTKEYGIGKRLPIDLRESSEGETLGVLVEWNKSASCL